MDINFERSIDLKHLICTCCHDILQKPLMITQCEHSFCGLCLTEWLRINESNPSCPECKIPVEASEESVKRAMFIFRLINSANVICKSCETAIPIIKYKDHAEKCSQSPRHNNPTTLTATEIMNLSPSKPVPKFIEQCVSHVIGLKIKQTTSLPCGTVQIQTKGSTVSSSYFDCTI